MADWRTSRVLLRLPALMQTHITTERTGAAVPAILLEVFRTLVAAEADPIAVVAAEVLTAVVGAAAAAATRTAEAVGRCVLFRMNGRHARDRSPVPATKNVAGRGQGAFRCGLFNAVVTRCSELRPLGMTDLFRVDETVKPPAGSEALLHIGADARLVAAG